ncbi:ammonia-dependent NAD(+) synthetase [Patescibacteria group bacterium]
MYKKPIEEVVAYYVERFRDWIGNDNAFIASSGGADSALVICLAREALGEERVITMFRDICSDPKHRKDATEVAEVLGVKFWDIDGNPAYNAFLEQVKPEAKRNGTPFYEEGSEEARNVPYIQGGYESCKSRATTFMVGLISKWERARIIGTGNLVEDLVIRFYDKYGDNAVDFCLIVGLTKMEVWQMLLYFADKYNAEVLRRIAYKIPSPDLQAVGDKQNDEDQITAWAQSLGYKIDRLSYGSLDREGNIGRICKEEVRRRVVSCKYITYACMRKHWGYTEEDVEVVKFFRYTNKVTEHKDLKLPGIPRQELMDAGLVD